MLIDIPLLLALAGVLLNLGALVWGASRIATELGFVKQVASKLENKLETVIVTIGNQSERLAVLERDVDSLERQVADA